MISAVVPTFRGGARLARNLPSVAAALEAADDRWEIVVVDDGGGEVGELAPGARVVGLPENRGYGPAVNAGVMAARGERLLILNDDVRLEPDAVKHLAARFPDARLFAAVPSIRSPLAACGDEAGKHGRFDAGEIALLERPPAADTKPRPTLYPVGCCFLCTRDAWEALGGYDAIYAPFFWEDVELGWRAWRRGWRVEHVPDAVCHHEGSATLREHRSVGDRERVSFRNGVVFRLRTLSDPTLRAEVFGGLLARALFDTDVERRAGLVEALDRYAAAGPRLESGASDADILAAS